MTWLRHTSTLKPERSFDDVKREGNVHVTGWKITVCVILGHVHTSKEVVAVFGPLLQQLADQIIRLDYLNSFAITAAFKCCRSTMIGPHIRGDIGVLGELAPAAT